jgi:DNA-directed RNA polymerase subunit RPC12/RpoP
LTRVEARGIPKAPLFSSTCFELDGTISVLIREFPCPHCGAPRETLDDAQVVFCGYCGAVVDLDTERVFRGPALADLRDSQIVSLIRPSRAEARKSVLGAAMTRAAGERDRRVWRAAAREFFILVALTDPSFCAPEPSVENGFTTWLREILIGAERAAFHETGGPDPGPFSRACSRMGREGNSVKIARDMLKEAEIYCRALAPGTRGNTETSPLPPHVLARQMVRSAVEGLETFLGPVAVERIYIEVLGDRDGGAPAEVTCSGCGAILATEDVVEGKAPCVHCGSVVRVDSDPWLSSTLALWETTYRDLARRGKTRTTEVVISALATSMNPLWLGGKIEWEDGLRFLREAIPWVEKGVIEEGIRIYASAFVGDEAKTRFLEGLLDGLASWNPSGKPPEVDPLPLPPPSEASAGESPWVNQAVAHWELASKSGGPIAPELEVRLLGASLVPFHLGGAISVGEALEFYGRAEPGHDRSKLAQTARTFIQGFPEGSPLAAFLEELVEVLQGTEGP